MRHDSAFGDNSKDGKAREFSERSWHSSGGTSSPFRLVGSLQLYSPPAMGGVWNSRVHAPDFSKRSFKFRA